MVVISGGTAFASMFLHASTVFGGVPISQAFAIGLLAYNCTMAIVGPLLGMEAELVETVEPQVVSKPGQTPRHPSDKKNLKNRYNVINGVKR